MGVIHLWNISKWARWQPIALIEFLPKILKRLMNDKEQLKKI